MMPYTRGFLCLLQDSKGLFLPFTGHSKACAIYFFQVLCNLLLQINNRGLKPDKVLEMIQTTCKFPNYSDTANISNIIMMAKRENAALKKKDF